MHAFDTARPQITPGQPALTLGQTTLPSILVVIKPNGLVRLMAMLRHYDVHGGYSYKHHDLPDQDLPQFFSAYRENPEATLKLYFDWEQGETKKTYQGEKITTLFADELTAATADEDFI